MLLKKRIESLATLFKSVIEPVKVEFDCWSAAASKTFSLLGESTTSSTNLTMLSKSPEQYLIGSREFIVYVW